MAANDGERSVAGESMSYDSIGLARRAALRRSGDERTINLIRLRRYRLARVQAQLKAYDLAGAILFDPINVHYATGSRNQTLWKMHSWGRYAFVPADGSVTLFDSSSSLHLARGIETIAEARPSTGLGFIYGGDAVSERAERWASEIADLAHAAGGAAPRIAIDRTEPLGAAALARRGIVLADASAPIDRARAIKSADEIACMKIAIAVCEAAMTRMREALEPGITENELWSILHQANIAGGGEWIETRMLSSGSRINPWYNESSDRVIEAGDLVGFDADMVGPFGYIADLSRTFLCGPTAPTREQRRLYRIAYDQLHHDLALIRPGLAFGEYTARAWPFPPEFLANRYGCVVHGAGSCDEYPTLGYPTGPGLGSAEGAFEPGMVVCVESYIGAAGARDGVKLEDQVLITDTGYENLTHFPFESAMLA
ncbi:MAG: aminopeptidase P family protein [Alphaproteobacteria bacterium]|nr:aminopeptidase P family protein [Alphaproteobacteria bacterium]